MTILDRYITREFVKTFFFVMLAFVCLFLIVDFFERIRMFLSNNANLQQIIFYHLYTLPMVISMLLPACVLLAALITFGSLSQNQEIIAMKANGISLHTIARPVLVFAVLACGVNFFFNEFITPAANWKSEYIMYVDIQKKKDWGVFKQNQIWFKSSGAIYHFRYLSPQDSKLRGVTVNYLDPHFKLVSRLDAKEAVWNSNGQWELRDVLRTDLSGTHPALQRLPSVSLDMGESPANFQELQKTADQMGFRELRNFIRKLRHEGYDATQYETDLQGKISFVFVSLILAVIGVAFPMRSERSGGIAQGIGIGVIIGFSYWVVFAFFMSLGRSGSLPPFVAAWATNVILGFIAYQMFRRVNT